MSDDDEAKIKTSLTKITRYDDAIQNDQFSASPRSWGEGPWVTSSSSSGTVLAPQPQPQPSSRIRTASSEFGDSACGARLRSHHLVVDFSPRGEDGLALRKSCAFWAMVAERPEMQALIQEPYPWSQEAEARDAAAAGGPSPPPPPLSAVAQLHVADQAGWLTRAFASRLPRGCSPRSEDYCQDDSRRFPKPPSQRSTRAASSRAPPPAPDRARELCRRLRQWDRAHPKSMRPPGHPPSLADSAH